MAWVPFSWSSRHFFQPLGIFWPSLTWAWNLWYFRPPSSMVPAKSKRMPSFSRSLLVFGNAVWWTSQVGLRSFFHPLLFPMTKSTTVLHFLLILDSTLRTPSASVAWNGIEGNGTYRYRSEITLCVSRAMRVEYRETFCLKLEREVTVGHGNWMEDRWDSSSPSKRGHVHALRKMLTAEISPIKYSSWVQELCVPDTVSGAIRPPDIGAIRATPHSSLPQDLKLTRRRYALTLVWTAIWFGFEMKHYAAPCKERNRNSHPDSSVYLCICRYAGLALTISGWRLYRWWRSLCA